MSIQRYSPFAGGSMVEDDNGGLVKYTSHAAEVEQMTGERDKLQKHVEDVEKIAFARESAFVAERDAAIARAERAEERERRLVEIISGLVSHLELCRDMDFPGDSEEDKAVLASVNAILEEARAALADMEQK